MLLFSIPLLRSAPMAQKLDEKELVTFKEMLMANSIMVDALAQLLMAKGLFTEEELYRKLKEVQDQYNAAKRDAG
jgi:hypothetical protein